MPTDDKLSAFPLSPTQKEQARKKRTVPPSINENVFAAGAYEQDEFILSARLALLEGRRAGERSLAAADAHFANVMETEPARHRSTRNSVNKIAGPALQAIEAAIAKLDGKIADVNDFLLGPPAPKKGEVFALLEQQEVRQALAGMDAARRKATIKAAIDAGDVTVATAVLRGSPFLMRISHEEQLDHRLHWQRVAHADKVAYLGALNEAADAMKRAHHLLGTFTTSLYDADLIKRAEEFERRAHDAAAA